MEKGNIFTSMSNAVQLLKKEKKNSVWFEEEMSFEFEVFKLNI